MHTEQLRCTPEEIGTFFEQVIDIRLPKQIIQEITARTEGWLVGLQLLGLSLLGVKNRVQAVRQAQAFGLLD